MHYVRHPFSHFLGLYDFGTRDSIHAYYMYRAACLKTKQDRLLKQEEVTFPWDSKHVVTPPPPPPPASEWSLPSVVAPILSMSASQDVSAIQPTYVVSCTTGRSGVSLACVGALSLRQIRWECVYGCCVARTQWCSTSQSIQVNGCINRLWNRRGLLCECVCGVVWGWKRALLLPVNSFIHQAPSWKIKSVYISVSVVRSLASYPGLSISQLEVHSCVNKKQAVLFLACENIAL